MKIIDIVKYKVKYLIRSKELYLYIIGFPLIFLLIYGSMAYATYSTPTTITVGYMNLDQGTTINFGDTHLQLNYSEGFLKYLDNLTYNGTNTKMYNLVKFNDKNEARDKVVRLEVAAVIVIPKSFSKNLLEFAKSIAYYQIMDTVTAKLQEAYKEGNTTLANKCLEIINETEKIAPTKYNLTIEIIGDPTYSKAMNTYEGMWKNLIEYASLVTRNFTSTYTKYLEEKYQVKILEENSTEKLDFTKTFNIVFETPGATGSLKESFAKMYFAVLVPGQIMQSIMLGAIAAIYMVGGEIETGFIHRIKLTKVRSEEYIGGALLTWGIISLFQSAVLITVSLALGYVKVGGDPINYVLALVVLVLAGIITAAISLIIVSFVSPKVAGTVSMIVIIILSLYLAGYFPVPNLTFGYFMGREFTLLDIFPWRAGITALRKTLMLAELTKPQEALPDISLLTIWTIFYSMLAFYIFNKFRLKSVEKE